ncbi:MAG: Rrf2 family transcriptional regulator [Pseudomonadota bacterium]
MAHIGSSVEYGLHCLLWLVEPSVTSPSSRDLAEFQGVSPSFMAKILPKLEKAGFVAASEGIRGGYRLARSPDKITVLDIVDALEGRKPLFDCQEIRSRCALYGGKPPARSLTGVCGIHAVMLRAEQSMRDELARTTLADIASGVQRKMPAGFSAEVQTWFNERAAARTEARGTQDASERKAERQGRRR